MLISLEIRNFLLIKKISINFINGFNTFTGETGAGKSIIINGIKLALGGKNKTNLNLNKNEIANIKAVFEIDKKINNNLKDLSLVIDDDYLIVERQINSDQKSKILLNGQIVSQSIIKKLLNDSIEFQENYEQQELFDNKYFLNFIDKIGKIDISNLKNIFVNLKEIKSEYITFINDEKNILEKLEILKIKKDKFKLLNPKEGEYNSLIDQKNINKNSKKINDISNDIKKEILEFNNKNNLIDIDKSLMKLSDIDDEFQEVSKKISSNYYEIIELLNEVENKFQKYEFDEVDYDYIDDRIYQYQQLSKFFDVESNRLHELSNKINEEIALLEDFDNQKRKLSKKYEDQLALYRDAAKKISIQRRKQAELLIRKINNELPSMNIEQGEINFIFSEADEDNYNANGYDVLEVLFRTSKKNDFSSIKKVASGGELSRLLLIIKSMSGEFDNNLTIIFDEVDSGLSGKIASNVSDKILKLSKNNQIIAITHSAQVASRANKHWKIEKKLENDEMISSINELDNNERIYEIATLISGSNVTDESKMVAKDLIARK